MTSEDNPKAFLESFERAAMTTGLDKSKWAVKVGVLLVGLVQVAYQALSQLKAQDYDTMKEQILYCLDITSEWYSQLLHGRRGKTILPGCFCRC